jgi:hypothetical protein
MDKELIAMCDCPEIQGKRQLYFGDKIYCPTYKSHGIYMGDGSAELENGHAVDQETLIFIPRIEDVKSWFTEEQLYAGISIDMKNLTIKHMIHFYMYLEHGKTWDSEQWK